LFIFLALKDNNGNWVKETLWTEGEIKRYFEKLA